MQANWLTKPQDALKESGNCALRTIKEWLITETLELANYKMRGRESFLKTHACKRYPN